MTTAVFLFSLIVVPAFAQDLQWVDKLAEQAHKELSSQKDYEKQIATSLRTARLQLKAAQRAPVKPPNDLYGPQGTYKSFGTAESKDNSVSLLQSEVDRLEAIDKSKAPPKPDFPILKSDVGRPMNRSVYVVQVISPDEAIVKILLPGGKFLEMWLHADTRGWTDKATVSFDLPVIVTGTTQYDTVIGSSRTIREARVWTQEEIKRFNNWRPVNKN